MFINIIRSLGFSSDGILKTDLLNGIFIGSGEKTFSAYNAKTLIITDEGVLHLAQKIDKKYEIIKEASIETAKEIIPKMENYESILAVGSGSVFDVAKYVAHLTGKPFSGFCTALSMNAYLSSNASLYENGLKKSFKAKLPSSLYFDLEILKHAPESLTKAGFGDSLARITAQNDCLLSSLQKNTPYPVELFNFRLPSEEFLLENYTLLLQKDDEFYMQLLENILFSGLAMHLFGSSFPASGGEHAMAHVAEMQFKNIKGFWHGLQISAFTVEMLEIQKQFSQYNPLSLNSKKPLKEIFQHLGMPSGFSDLGLSENDFNTIKLQAKSLRDRFSFLNLL